MRFLPFTLQKAPFCKVKGKKLQAKGFISSVTVDLSYSKSAKKKVLRRDTKQGIQANKKIYCERTRVFIFYFVCAAALTGRVPSLSIPSKETRIGYQTRDTGQQENFNRKEGILKASHTALFPSKPVS